MTDAGVYCHAGPEQAVASTKAFIAQVTVLTLIALHLSDGSTPLYKPLLQELDDLPAKAQEFWSRPTAIKVSPRNTRITATSCSSAAATAPLALEGALKLKEISYIHAEGYAAGEMKHGPLAMIDENFPTFAMACDSPLLEKTYSNIEEIRARKGQVVAIATEGNETIQDSPTTSSTFRKPWRTRTDPDRLVMQLFSYYVAVAKGLNVDRPRNLAKSVTVE